ncbi:alpha-1,6-mannosylglycoprotein 6-beta-N-acetylglucosaminyltransferase A-like [Orbicella faveolata]|uniref:alpha-1,6-mannosylglycoprotein 6-beta-N-acetylglucosaminyltransferase A-like n=1 Tax=Orbicella faveolata TaxID=48498 RepID=UPI0009E3AFD1|nr:alpha-1,6-mannosylglycoprotein 6-beta-N-acetylglucosaminyltransferase A-like [Orbicella faveolata]
MKLKRSFSTKRCLLFWACLVGLTVLLQNAIVILVSICNKGSCCLKLGEADTYPTRKLDHDSQENESSRLLHQRSQIDSTPEKMVSEALEDHPEEITTKSTTCEIPEDPKFPLCSMKVKSFSDAWNTKCHGEKHHVTPNNLCSVIQYLSEVEAWCPVLPWRRDHDPFKPSVNFTEAKIRTNVSGLLEELKDERYAWMRLRITETWPQWVEAIKQLAITRDMSRRKRRKIALYMGSLEFNFKIFTEAFTGGCLGELSQWSDVMSALYILGHDLTVTSDKNDLPNIITPPDPDGCASRLLGDNLNLIFTDIIGVQSLADASGPHESRYRCKMRVLDSFGTDAEFNYRYYKENIPGGRSIWGNLNLLLPQFMTMYPHSPDNSFMGFAVPQKQHSLHVNGQKSRKHALVYGKLPHFWQGKTQYIDTIKKYFGEVHANIGNFNESELRKYDIPDYIINHGIVNISTLMNLFQSSKVFVGLGDPFEGPAALEALANGCYFINPKFNPPFDRVNHGFFVDKPMDRKITSQNPYVEVFVGEPFVQTVNIENIAEVEEALQRILDSSASAHLPYEFTVTGMLERLNAYIEHQDFCKPNNWPPIKELKITTSKDGQSCEFACLEEGLVCEPTFFTAINTQDTLTRAGLSCNASTTVSRDSILAPSLDTSNNLCLLQSQSLLFSCRAARPGVVRLCPCRSYRKEQVALCETCLENSYY